MMDAHELLHRARLTIGGHVTHLLQQTGVPVAPFARAAMLLVATSEFALTFVSPRPGRTLIVFAIIAVTFAHYKSAETSDVIVRDRWTVDSVVVGAVILEGLFTLTSHRDPTVALLTGTQTVLWVAASSRAYLSNFHRIVARRCNTITV